MFSSITMALSTTIPTAKAIPASMTTFKLRPSSVTARNVPITEIGIASATTAVADALRRNRSKIPVARSPPKIMLLLTNRMAEWM